MSKLRRVKFRFSLTALFVAILALAVWLAVASNRDRHQAAAVVFVEANGGTVLFESTIDAPEWVTRTIGEEWFRRAVSVEFVPNRGRKTDTDQPKVTDESLARLERLTTLEILELSSLAAITDAGLVHLKGFNNLTHLYLDRTRIRGPGLVHLTKLPYLERISLRECPLQDAATDYLGSMPRLTSASLSHTQLTDSGMAGLANASGLTTLSLMSTPITDPGLMELVKLDRLQALNITGTRVTAKGVTRFERLRPECKVSFRLGDAEIAQDEAPFPPGYLPTADEVIARLDELDIDCVVKTDATRPDNPIVGLRLSNCTLSSNAVLSLIEHMPELEWLDIRRGLVDDGLAEGLAGSKLRYLSLQGTRITDNGLQYLVGISTLRELVLRETDVSDDGLTHLVQMKQLLWLDLGRSRITAGGMRRVRQSLPNCYVDQL